MDPKDEGFNKSEDQSTFTFGDTEALCNRLLELVMQGRKTATCGALHDFNSNEEDFPVVGRQDIALNWDGTPALIIETTNVEIMKFCDVEDSFALAEGENETLEGWRSEHKAYFERNGGFDPEMILVCERFKLIKNLNVASS